ncbi:hypothetical protein HNR42_001244 [Deinobacterium chartae]|uniref:Uncharacterized protein n=1 Tax=Deinobacterium chartae TaxID=521158 RepID=A0A841HWB0_9DEIO|nr:DUF3197 domain-containing protein [Deinobacterium chartae]MBB6097821.1 hypothetical protein [Deinobacterium chartae]
MHIADPIGVPGAPAETLTALLQQARFGPEAALYLLTDTQGQRREARYSLLLHRPDHDLLTREAFGGRFGEAGIHALATAVNAALEGGVTRFFETVIDRSDFNRMVAEPDPHELRVLLASANPTDPMIYTHPGGW